MDLLSRLATHCLFSSQVTRSITLSISWKTYQDQEIMVGETTSANGSAIQYLDTASTYDLWAQHYDTDGNFLTAIDSIEMQQDLLPQLFSLLSECRLPPPHKIVDLGCGTGRNTVDLADHPNTTLVALDLSPKMLALAQQRLQNANITTAVYDMLASPAPPSIALDAAAVVSTLVVEHIPLAPFFRTVTAMLRPGGVLLLTNMHDEMGRVTQAGFVDPVTGQRIRPTSYAHSVEEILAEAGAWGMEVVVSFRERRLTEEDMTMLTSRAKKYLGMKVWYGGILRKSVEGVEEAA